MEEREREENEMRRVLGESEVRERKREVRMESEVRCGSEMREWGVT